MSEIHDIFDGLATNLESEEEIDEENHNLKSLLLSCASKPMYVYVFIAYNKVYYR